MRYRSATLADAPVLAQMNHELIRDEGHGNPMSIAQLASRMTGWLRGEYEAVLFWQEDQLAGYAPFKSEGASVYLRQFFIQRPMRRRGYGRAAVEWLVTNPWKARPVRLDVLVGNAVGIQFWKSVGFTDYCITMERPA